MYHTYGPYGVTNNINLVNSDLTIAGLMDGYILCERDKMCLLEKAFLTAASRQTSTAMFQTCASTKHPTLDNPN